MKKIILALLIILVTAANAQKEIQFEKTYKFMRLIEPETAEGKWTSGQFKLIFNYENKIDKIQLAILKATLLFTSVGTTRLVTSNSGKEHEEIKLETDDGKKLILMLFKNEAQMSFSDGSGFELSN